MREQRTIWQQVDWVVVAIYSLFVLLGWLNIYAADYDEDLQASIFSLSVNSGKQFLWIITAILIIIVIMTIDFRIYDSLAYVFYGIVMIFIGIGAFCRYQSCRFNQLVQYRRF
ncbi:MAG: hypothetical protein U5K79_03745 [Cyclobacteriaceae bacterium]|nr:hypothetical protein [Cyclobacteriaceae bacterium]